MCVCVRQTSNNHNSNDSDNSNTKGIKKSPLLPGELAIPSLSHSLYHAVPLKLSFALFYACNSLPLSLTAPAPAHVAVVAAKLIVRSKKHNNTLSPCVKHLKNARKGQLHLVTTTTTTIKRTTTRL